MIRLQRTGRRGIATYRLVVAEKRRAVQGRFLEIVGHYLTDRHPAVWEVQNDRIRHWLKHGAAPSSTVARLLVKGGMQEAQPFVKRYVHRKKKGEEKEQPVMKAPKEDKAEEKKEEV